MIENVIIFCNKDTILIILIRCSLSLTVFITFCTRFFCIRDIPFQNFGSLRIPTQFSRLGSIYLSFGGFQKNVAILNLKLTGRFFFFCPTSKATYLFGSMRWYCMIGLAWNPFSIAHFGTYEQNLYHTSPMNQHNLIEQHVLDTYAEKQLSQAATDV
jgi:hypothetical protein